MKRIFVTGDIHGEIDIAKLFNFQKKLKTLGDKYHETDVMIIAGDWGLVWALNPKNGDEVKYKTKLNSHGCTYFVVLGNHENFDRIEKLPVKQMFGGTVQYEPEYPNIVYAINGDYYRINEKLIWTMGGGFSIDKYRRTPGISWWPQEVPTPKQLAECWETYESGKRKDIDYVISHTCPLNFIPHDKATHLDPDEINQDLEIFLQRVYDDLSKVNKTFKWYFGHYHVDEVNKNVRCLYKDVLLLD